MSNLVAAQTSTSPINEIGAAQHRPSVPSANELWPSIVKQIRNSSGAMDFSAMKALLGPPSNQRRGTLNSEPIETYEWNYFLSPDVGKGYPSHLFVFLNSDENEWTISWPLDNACLKEQIVEADLAMLGWQLQGIEERRGLRRPVFVKTTVIDQQGSSSQIINYRKIVLDMPNPTMDCVSDIASWIAH